MHVWVLATNPRRRFYEALGGRLIQEEQVFTVDGTDFDEVAYAWDDLRTLLTCE